MDTKKVTGNRYSENSPLIPLFIDRLSVIPPPSWSISFHDSNPDVSLVDMI